MEISEVRVKLVDRAGERLRAFCSITLDGAFVIRDLKIIGGSGGVFVAMPSRKLSDRCPKCGCKNHLRARFCNECGGKLTERRASRDLQGRAKLHADIAHPINAVCRERIQKAVMEAFEAELERSKSPDYEPTEFDDLDEETTSEFTPAEPIGQRSKERATVPVASHDDEEDDDVIESVSDYNSLIADLKQEAATRHEKRREKRAAPPSYARIDFGQDVSSDSQIEVPDSGAGLDESPALASVTEHLSDNSEETSGEEASTRAETPARTSACQRDRGNDAFGAGVL